MNRAILLSGGVGTRIQSEAPKQYIRIKGKMMVTYSLLTLSKSPLIDSIHIVAEEQWWKQIIEDAGKSGVFINKIYDFSLPGINRQTSILNGMNSILKYYTDRTNTIEINECDNLLIHDAARPLLSKIQIEECFNALQDHDGVMPVLPMKDTVYFSGDGNKVTKLLDRRKIFAGQAPEVFNMKKYYQSSVKLTQQELLAINGSTEPAIMAGMDIILIKGDENNFKVTTNEDLERMRTMI